jgi:hypothetical protein
MLTLVEPRRDVEGAIQNHRKPWAKKRHSFFTCRCCSRAGSCAHRPKRTTRAVLRLTFQFGLCGKGRPYGPPPNGTFF